MSLTAFTPSAAVTVAPGVTQGTAIIGGTGHYLRICNAGAGNAYIAFFEASQTPPTLVAGPSLLIPAGAIEIFSVASDTTRVAFLGDATGTSLNLCRGEGQ
jgi:hypothetical protein